MAVEHTVEGVTVGLRAVWPLVALPVVLAALAYLLFRGRKRGSASDRSRRLLFVSRGVVACLLVLAAAGPYTVVTRATAGEPQVTLLVDESDSMAVYDDGTDRLVDEIEAEGVPVTTATIASGSESRIGDAIVANLRENSTVVVRSDGQITDGRSLQATAQLARSMNATVSTVTLDPTRMERAVSVTGPAKTSVGLDNRFRVRIDGTRLDEAPDTTLRVTIDGEEVLTRSVGGAETVEVVHAFNDTGTHRVTAAVDSDDAFERNDVFRTSVRVVEPPKVLYVSQGSYPFESYLSELYNIDVAESVPSNLDGYAAVVVQDVPAADLGDTDALKEFVIDGGGLLVVGGDNSFEGGGYEGSPVASMLPVHVGDAAGGTANIVLLVDISGSAQASMRVQKAIALDVLDQLGNENRVGLVAFSGRAYEVAQFAPLGESRAEIAEKIRRLETDRGTRIDVGLEGADELLGDREGTILLLSDGRDRPAEPAAVAAQLGAEGTRVIAVGAGESVNELTLRRVAAESGGSYFHADETERLRLLFGGASRQFEGDRLTVVTSDTFVTSGLELTADPANTNDVSVKSGADYLVAAGNGQPAVASWRFGLGRVATVTAYGADGSLDGLLEAPDSLLLTRSTNYVIGDPERGRTDVVEAADTRVGEPTTVTYRGESRPDAADATFQQVEPGRYRATVTPTDAGYHSILTTEYAANYPREYGAFGPDPALDSLVEATGGHTYHDGQAADIATFAREEATRVRAVRSEWDWLALLAALLAFVTEVVIRRIQVYRRETSLESGLT